MTEVKSGDPITRLRLGWTMKVETGWEDCRHGRHPYRAFVEWPLTDVGATLGCGNSLFAAVRDAFRNTDIEVG